MTEVAEQVREIIATHFKERGIDPARVVPKAHLHGDLEADSLDLVEIAFALEDHFGREITEPEMNRIMTVGDIIALIGRSRQVEKVGLSLWLLGVACVEPRGHRPS
jgi:acyl carrier protein